MTLRKPARIHPGRPPRLDIIHQRYSEPLWYLTLTTWNRKPWLAEQTIQDAVIAFSNTGVAAGRAFLGRYVLMPDHAHLFVQLSRDESLGTWVKAFKATLAKAANRTGRSWQPGFFDHLIRSNESYDEKWNYVRENPMRAGLVDCSENWPYQGEPVPLTLMA
jgi:REP element-mobilizing transposase RayT